jgi:hypothetical protein
MRITASAGVTTSAGPATSAGSATSVDKATEAEKAACAEEPAGVVTRDKPGQAERGGNSRWFVDGLKQGGAPYPHRERDLPAFRLPVSRSARHRYAAQMQELPEVQGMPVPSGLADLQGEPRISGHPGRPRVRRGAQEVDGVLSLLHPPIRADEQLQPSVQVHPVPRKDYYYYLKCLLGLKDILQCFFRPHTGGALI